MAKQAYAFAHQRFTLERMVSEHDSLYRSLLFGSSELPSQGGYGDDHWERART